MGILSRFFRICKSGIHGVMDLLEDRELLLKQHIRDMETALADDRAGLNQKEQALEQAVRDYEACFNECEKLEQDLAAAIQKPNDPVARLIIKKLKPKEDCRNELAQQIGRLEENISRLGGQIEKQQTELRQIRLKAGAHVYEAGRKRRDTNTVCDPDAGIGQEMTEEEVECELFRRKQKLEKGAQP